MRAVMAGCGKMGNALLRQWVTQKDVSFSVVDPFAKAEDVPAPLVNDVSELQNVAHDICVVAVKPQMIGDVMPAYRSILADDALVLSMAAGVSADRLKGTMQNERIVRIMPNMPAAIGRGVTGLYATPAVSEELRNVAQRLLSCAGETVWVESEDQLDRLTAIAGSGPGYIFELARAYGEAARKLGFTEEESRKLVLGTIAGTIDMAQQTGTDLTELRDSVTSKAGTTEAGLKALNGKNELGDLLERTTLAAYERAVELR